MTFLFCHDHRFLYAANGDVYSPGQYDARVLKRYTDVFGSLHVASRGKNLDSSGDVQKLSLCSGPNVNFSKLPNLSSPVSQLTKRRETEAALAELMRDVQGVIVRLPSELGLVALSVAKRLNKPALVEVVACVWDGLRSHGSHLASLYAPIAYRRMKRAVADADWAVYVTSKFLQQRYPCRGATIGVSDVEVAPPNQAVFENRMNGYGRQQPVRFGMIAALFHRQKGVDVAVKAFQKAIQTSPDIQLHILGPGDTAPWKQTAKETGLADAVEFCGTLPRGEPVLRWLDGMDVYIQASFQEGLPRALIEAMSRGCPALVSNAGGSSELVSADCLHEPGDNETLAQGIMRAAKDEKWRRAQAQQNYTTSLEYAPEELRKRREAFWREFITSAR